ncbi:hypothetical protein Btru_062897 [Bulinus truncatus]|nr:hypothetical protein Btru_062897 [Bulinus truncatus]
MKIFREFFVELVIFGIINSQTAVNSDKCPPDFSYEVINDFHTCLLRSTTAVTWQVALSRCKEKKSLLVSIKNWETLAMIGKTNINYWIGLHFDSVTQDFKWLDTSIPITIYIREQLFPRGEPLNWGRTPRCMLYEAARKSLKDNLCFFYYRYICQVKPLE